MIIFPLIKPQVANQQKKSTDTFPGRSTGPLHPSTFLDSTSTPSPPSTTRKHLPDPFHPSTFQETRPGQYQIRQPFSFYKTLHILGTQVLMFKKIEKLSKIYSVFLVWSSWQKYLLKIQVKKENHWIAKTFLHIFQLWNPFQTPHRKASSYS